MAKALEAKGVPTRAISVIPDEQAATETALRMGRSGDLLLIFADALTRSWKQIIKFRPEGAAAPEPAAPRSIEPETAAPGLSQEEQAQELEGLIRDERGVRFARENED
jgi:cyanophycin synthetase